MTEDAARQACKDNYAIIVRVIVPLMIADKLRKTDILLLFEG
jgi:hypothetical protein